MASVPRWLWFKVTVCGVAAAAAGETWRSSWLVFGKEELLGRAAGSYTGGARGGKDNGW